MIALGVYWIKSHYKGDDHGGMIYWDTTIVDVVMLLCISN